MLKYYAQGTQWINGAPQKAAEDCATARSPTGS